MIINSDPIDGTIERREWFAKQEGRQEGILLGKQEGILLGKHEGILLGKQEGILLGKQEGVNSVIEGALRSGKSPEMVAEFINIPLNEVLSVQKSMLEEA